MTRLTTVDEVGLDSIDTQAVRDRLGDPGTAIVDVRPLAAYNGWRLDGEERGGHIPGATAFPAPWLLSIDEAEVSHLLREKGIRDATTVVVYGARADHALALASTLRALGQPDVRIYEDGWSAWSADPSLPVERLTNHTALVHTAWLRELIDGGRPEAAPDGDWLLFHVNFGVPEEYLDSHLPGALYLDTNRLEDPADWNRRDPDELEATLSALGITADTSVVLYGRDTEGHAEEKWPGRRAGQIAATRAALDPQLRGRQGHPRPRRRI